MKNIYICLAMDDNYAQLASVSIQSILENNGNMKIEFFLLDSGISKENKDVLTKQICDCGQKVQFYNVSEDINRLSQMGLNPQGAFKSFAAYSRFFLIDKLPEYVDRILYLDCDTCVVNNMEELFNVDLEDNVIGAIIDILPDFHKKSIGFGSSDIYYNSGVLLFNCAEWKKGKYLDKITNLLVNEKVKYSFHDQDIINIVCKDRIKTLHPKYMVFVPDYSWGVKWLLRLTELNVSTYYTKEEIESASKTPVIIHYVESIMGRPWFTGNNFKLYNDWHYYLDKCPYKDNYKYYNKASSFGHKVLEKTYLYLPHFISLYVYKRRKYKVLRRRENIAK